MKVFWNFLQERSTNTVGGHALLLFMAYCLGKGWGLIAFAVLAAFIAFTFWAFRDPDKKT